MSEAQTWWVTELYPTKDAENFGLAGDFEVVRIEDYQVLLDERDRLKRALEEIAMGTAVWERDEMIDCATAALMPAGGGKNE